MEMMAAEYGRIGIVAVLIAIVGSIEMQWLVVGIPASWNWNC